MSKGNDTRERILDQAIRLASVEGLQALTIGRLADDLHLSKSGLFAHFGSKEALQADVVRATVDNFRNLVLEPAEESPAGARRLRKLFELWVAWGGHESMPGGCVLTAVSSELDDQPSPARDVLEGWSRKTRGTLCENVKAAQEKGELRAEVEPAQFAFEMVGILLVMHRQLRLLRDREGALRMGDAAFQRLMNWAKA